MKLIKRVSLLLLLVPLSLFARQQAYDVTPADHNYGHAPLFYFDSKNSSIAVEEADFHCHKPADDVCHPLSLRNTSALLMSKQLVLEPPPGFDLAYKHTIPDSFLCETGANCYSDLTRAIITVPIYLATLRLRL